MVESNTRKPDKAKSLMILTDDQVKSHYSDIDFHEKDFMC